MAKVEYRTCDACGERMPDKAKPIHFPIGESVDVASGRTETEYDKVDQCYMCLRVRFVELMREITPEHRQEVYEKMKRMARDG